MKYLVLIVASAMFNESTILYRCATQDEAVEFVQAYQKEHPDDLREIAVVQILEVW